jgi:hypothetical protein
VHWTTEESVCLSILPSFLQAPHLPPWHAQGQFYLYSFPFLLFQKEVIQSEEDRRLKRLEGHYNNNVWQKRLEPPADWNKPLPERLIKEYENTYLYHRAKEVTENKPEDLQRTMCVLS